MGNTTNHGSKGEMLAALDLMSKGYEVFRALDCSASCDLIALKDTIAYRVQVKYIGLSRSAWRRYNPTPKELISTDIFMLVYDNGEIRSYTLEQMTCE